jgi:hypothetical protein
MVQGARGFLEMTELDAVAIQQRVPLRSGVQQPATMVYNVGLNLLIGKTLPARLTGCYYPRAFRSWKEIVETLVSNFPKLLSGPKSR